MQFAAPLRVTGAGAPFDCAAHGFPFAAPLRVTGAGAPFDCTGATVLTR